MDAELISVIVPIYNVEKYLEGCLNSILKQSYKNLEIILVEDGSSDRSREICCEYAKEDRRVKVVLQEHCGVAAARNRGIMSSTGSYITFIDSDDFIQGDYIRIMHQALTESGSDMVCCEFLCFADGKEADVRKTWDDGFAKGGGYKTYERMELVEKVLYQHISITGSQQKLYRRKVFEYILFPEGRIYEDLATTYRFILNSNHVSVIDKKLYAYRIRSNSIMNQAFTERKLDCVWVAETLYADINAMTPKLSKAAACACFRVNRLVFYQIPFKEKEKRDMVWREIKKYRGTVLMDSKVQLYERVLAMLSYSGPILFSCVLNLFQFLRKIRIILAIR